MNVANLLYDLFSTAKLYERQIVRCENVHMATQQWHVTAISPSRSMISSNDGAVPFYIGLPLFSADDAPVAVARRWLHDRSRMFRAKVRAE
jgi:hypothetical protein